MNILTVYRFIIDNLNFISGVRKPPVPFGSNGRSISGSVVPSSTAPNNQSNIVRNVTTPDPKYFERESPLSIYSSKRKS